jgi:hypothetical protein
MAPPNPAATSGPKALLKKIPPWGWAIGAGATLGIGWRLYKGRREPEALDAPVGEASLDPGTAGYDLATQPSPGGAYYPAPIGEDISGETIGAVGQTALETVIGGITGVVESLPTLIASVPQAPPNDPLDYGGLADLVNAIKPAAPIPQAPAPAAKPITTQPKPPTTTKPRGVTILGRTWDRAIGYKEIINDRRGRTFVISWPNRKEMWDTWVNKEGQRRWVRVWLHYT